MIACSIDSGRSFADAATLGNDNVELPCEPPQGDTEAAERNSHDLLRTIEQLAGVGGWEWDIGAKKVIWSEGLYRIFGQNPREWLPTVEHFLACIHPHDRCRVHDAIRASEIRREPFDIEFRIARPDGTERIAHSRAELTVDQAGKVMAMTGTCQDITERKLAETSLRNSEASFRLLVENAPDAIVLYDADQRRFIDANAQAECLFGCVRGEIVKHGPEYFYSPDQPDRQPVCDSVAAHDQQALAGMPLVYERRIRRPTGDDRVCQVTVVKLPSTTGHLLRGSYVDVTERKAAERSLERVNRALRTLSRGNEVVIRAASETELVDQMCRTIVELGGYRIAWIGAVEDDATKVTRIIACAGEGAEHLIERLHINPAAAGSAGSIGDRTIRTGKPVVSQNFPVDPNMAPWAKLAKEHGIASGVSLPLVSDSGIFGILQIFAAEPNAFDDDELKLLQELAGDLAYGLNSLAVSGRNAELERQWRSSLEAMIVAIANTVEMRDPYTAGHQQRVARLAVAIARELGISEHDSQGIYLAGIIHDVGKISIPGEILNKPGKLSRHEFALIQEHAEAGYAIIKDVQFPWPIAELVRQHHERLDGSGYPHGIRGNQILIGAKILAVADVVDAITSHRPYRPALGIETALEEIEKGKGRLFDPAAADACIALFREKGFSFADAGIGGGGTAVAQGPVPASPRQSLFHCARNPADR